jgi:chemotaxis protein methyltransferase CheR
MDRVMSNGNGHMPSLRIWSAACSTGQELYSIAIILKELLGDITQYRINLVGTDISDRAIAQASYGKFNKTELSRGLNATQISKYFTDMGTHFKISDEIRYMASFKKINLLEPFTHMGKFDIILCRNVAIYFKAEAKKRLFERLASQLNPQGVLMIGSTESLFGITDIYERKQYLNSTFYTQKV